MRSLEDFKPVPAHCSWGACLELSSLAVVALTARMLDGGFKKQAKRSSQRSFAR